MIVPVFIPTIGVMVSFIPINMCYCSSFLIIAILTNVKWYLIVVLITIGDVEHLFSYLWVIFMSLEKYLYGAFAHSLFELFFYYEVVTFLYKFWILTPHQIFGLQLFGENIF